ncbi:hypothetical protein [Clostridium rectalis]|uniref:hypothetical protein n=1 Tax=Clostridium rectalis TaxID=2040295 RepID=UPI000F639A8F|nr:hypothetical protein [Clostridium rectalis]
MPYEVLAKVGLPTGILIIMSFLIWEWIKSNKNIHEDHKHFVNEVIKKCDDRECKLMQHIEKQDDNMGRITDTLEKVEERLTSVDTRLSNVEVNIKHRG